MIRAEKLSKAYQGVPAVSEVDLIVPEGELCVLLGPSGCGKSTLLRLINALTPADSGTVTVRGQDISRMPPEASSRKKLASALPARCRMGADVVMRPV